MEKTLIFIGIHLSLSSAYQKATTKTVVANFNFTANFAERRDSFLFLFFYFAFAVSFFAIMRFFAFTSFIKFFPSKIIQIRKAIGVTSTKAGTIIQNQGQYFSCPAYCPTGTVLKISGVNMAKKLPIASFTPGPHIYDVFL